MAPAPAKTILTLPAAALDAGSAVARLGDHLALHYEGVLDRPACAAFARGVYAGRDHWTPNFDGVQFTLGRAFYTHLETDREGEYFADVRRSDEVVERFVPGLAARLLAMVSRALGARVVRREGWCGPGVHVFPSGEWVSHHGGDVHFDLEGLTDPHLAAHEGALSAVLMLQPAALGGGLTLWEKLWEGEGTTEEADESTPSAVIRYGAGDLVLFDSYRLHQICPSGGPIDRLSATAHLARIEGGWEAWF